MLYVRRIDMDLTALKAKIPDSETIDDLTELFKILGDPTRCRILFVLASQELNVSDISECVDMTKYAVSHQLRLLRQVKLVKARRSGKEVFYSLDDTHVSQVFECALAHVME